MDGKDKIIEEILNQANVYANSTTEKAQALYDSLISNANVRAEEIISNTISACENEQAETLKRREVVAKLDGKKLYLSNKTKAVDKVFENTLEKLNNLDKPTYRSFIALLINKYVSNNERIILAKNCPFSVDEVSKFEEVKSKQIKVLPNGNFNGGIMVQSQSADINLSFEAIIKSVKEGLETKIAQSLFED